MKNFRLRSDLTRAVVNGFALPLGFAPGKLIAPNQGYAVTYTSGEGDEPDTYTFQVAVSHERLAALCRRCLELLPREVYGIFELGSRDAYRTVDVYVGAQPIDRLAFQEVWEQFEPILLEDGSIAAGANGDEPYVEFFLDQRKTVMLYVPLWMHDDAESLLQEMGLHEVPETWPEQIDPESGPEIRPVLELTDEYCPDVDELLLHLRYSWRLQLDLDPTTNLDEVGRELGSTLWHAVTIVLPADAPEDQGAYMSFWLTATSMAEAQELIEQEMIASHAQWLLSDIYTIDRVAFDERPDELGDLPPRDRPSRVHLVGLEPWVDPPGTGGDG